MRVRLIALVAVVLALYGCSKDCPVCPTDKPESVYKGWLYYAEPFNDRYGAFRIDMETDSLVDSLADPPGNVAVGAITAVSPDGRFLAVKYLFFGAPNAVTKIYDAQTLTFIRDLSDPDVPYFDAHGDFLYGHGIDSYASYLRKWQLPTFNLVSTDTVHDFHFQLLDSKNRCFYGYGGANLREEYHLFKYDYVTKTLSRVPIVNFSGDTAKVFAFCLDSRGDKVYLKFIDGLVQPAGESYVAAYDLKTQEIVWQFRTLSPFGGVAVSPDDREVYMGDPGPPGYSDNTGTLFILDAASGSYLAGISLYGYLPYPYPTAAEEIIFSPKGDKAYISPGSLGDRPQGSVMVVDTKKREIIKVVSPDMQLSPTGMSIGPKF